MLIKLFIGQTQQLLYFYGYQQSNEYGNHFLATEMLRYKILQKYLSDIMYHLPKILQKHYPVV